MRSFRDGPTGRTRNPDEIDMRFWIPGSRALRAPRNDERKLEPIRCPSCGSVDTQVKDSRPTEDSAVIRRRRVCLTCNFRFTTFERVQLRELTVIKRNGRRVPFDRDKLMRSVQISLRKRPVEPERIEQMVSKIVRELESQGEAEISSEAIGEIVMEHLRELDDVAYVRFASVYRDFREAKDFRAALDELSGDDDGKSAASARK
jgi:transcriptional repressor NrdR